MAFASLFDSLDTLQRLISSWYEFLVILLDGSSSSLVSSGSRLTCFGESLGILADGSAAAAGERRPADLSLGERGVFTASLASGLKKKPSLHYLL